MLRKRFLTVLAAAAVMMTQVLPVSAATWVEDSSYPGGGYYMDDEGYIIEDGDPGVYNEIAPLTTIYEDGTQWVEDPVYSAPAPQSSASATWASIVPVASDRTDAQQFEVSSNGDVTFSFYINSVLQDGFANYDLSGGILSIYDTTQVYTVYVHDANNLILSSATSVLSHSYEVVYDIAGSASVEATGTVMNGESFTYTAPAEIEQNGTIYQLASADTLLIHYGQGTYRFTYEPYNPDAKLATVTYADEKGNVLQTVSGYVGFYDEQDLVFAIPATLNIDNRSYTKVDLVNQITVNFDSPQLNYTVTYRADDAVNTDPYSVRVQYVDSATGSVIGEDFLTVTADDIAADAVITFTVPAEIQTTSAGAVTYYSLADGETGVIEHSASDYGTAYTVSYSQIGADEPYTWSVRLIDTATGSVIRTDDQTVDPGTSAVYEPETQITVNGTAYVLDPGMSNRYVHEYADSSRILYVYYNEEGSPALQDYDLTIRYRSVTTDEVIFETTQTASATQASVIAAPENYTVGDTEYVKLQGQDDVDHEFYSPQRTYTIYYRDVNDIQNADTVVTEEQIITTVEPVYVDEEEIVEVAEEGTEAAEEEAAAPAGTTTVLANEETGEVTTLTDEGVPLANQDLDGEDADDGSGAEEETTAPAAEGAGETVTLEDESVPLASQDLAEESGTSYTLWIVLGAAAVIIVAGVAVFVKTRTK